MGGVKSMSLFYILIVLLLTTRIFGELAKRLGQPVLVGELVAGVFLGVMIQGMGESLPILSELQHNEVFEALTELAIFFLMLLAGVEMRPKKLREASGGAMIVAIGGMALPMASLPDRASGILLENGPDALSGCRVVRYSRTHYGCGVDGPGAPAVANWHGYRFSRSIR